MVETNHQPEKRHEGKLSNGHTNQQTAGPDIDGADHHHLADSLFGQLACFDGVLQLNFGPRSSQSVVI